MCDIAARHGADGPDDQGGTMYIGIGTVVLVLIIILLIILL